MVSVPSKVKIKKKPFYYRGRVNCGWRLERKRGDLDEETALMKRIMLSKVEGITLPDQTDFIKVTVQSRTPVSLSGNKTENCFVFENSLQIYTPKRYLLIDLLITTSQKLVVHVWECFLTHLMDQIWIFVFHEPSSNSF